MSRRGERGQVLPFIAVCLTCLMGFAGIAIDVGYLEYRQQQQQTATDAAVVGGAQSLVRSNCTGASSAVTAAQADAASNGFTNGGNVTVYATSPPSSGPYAGNTCAVYVSINTQHVGTFFARMFGYPSGMTETTQAVGSVTGNSDACIYLLSNNTWTSFNQATVVAPACAVAMNYRADFNGGSITSPFIGTAVAGSNMNGTSFPMASPTTMLPIGDPCGEIPGCAYLAANPPPQTNCNGLNTNGSNTTVQPGCYTYMNLDGGTITFAPGLYVITSNINDNGATITGSGVTLYIPAGGNPPNFNGDNVTLSPPTSGNYQGVLYYQVPSNTSGSNFNGANVNVSGLLYSPGANSVNFNGAHGGYVVLVFGSTNFNGNAAYDFASPPPGQSLVKSATLTQ